MAQNENSYGDKIGFVVITEYEGSRDLHMLNNHRQPEDEINAMAFAEKLARDQPGKRIYIAKLTRVVVIHEPITKRNL